MVPETCSLFLYSIEEEEEEITEGPRANFSMPLFSTFFPPLHQIEGKMLEELYSDGKGDSVETISGLHISSLCDEKEQQHYVVDADINGGGGDNDNDNDDGDDEDEPVTLGFVEKPQSNSALLRHLFPSKTGGVPAWLDPVNLPSGSSCKCDICGEPLQFLLQVYAPIPEKESTFHRTLFVFMCSSMACLLRDQHEQWKRQPTKACRSVKAFRCQLPRFNVFYPSEPPRYDGTDKPSSAGAVLCNWCGTWKGDKVCSSCRRANYCSEKHQGVHWHSGHKIDCRHMNISSQSSESSPSKSRITSARIQKVSSNTLWPEYEIINEDECEFDTGVSRDDEYANSLISRERTDDTVNSLMDNFEGDDDKKSWASFQERVDKAPEQVLRYSRNARAKPLWPMSGGRPSKADIPKCSYCGGGRSFEFQILPQLLYYFGVKNDVDSLDWATIVVYTCEASCEASVAYKEEFAWVQLSSQSSTLP